MATASIQAILSKDAPKGAKLKQVPLGNTGLFVSELCLGAMTFGSEATTNSWGMPVSGEADVHAILDRFVAAGGNFIDTADIYGPYVSEEVLGRWLAKQPNRGDLVIATKLRGRTGPGPNNVGLSRHHLVEGVDGALRRLQTPYIDLLQLHWEDPTVGDAELLRALDDLVRSGKVRYVGVSNHRAFRVAQMAEISRRYGWVFFCSQQVQYSLLCRETEFDMIPLAASEKQAVLPWSPLAGGLLTGRYSRADKAEAGSRVAWADNLGWKWTSKEAMEKDDRPWEIIEELKRVAAETGRSPSQVALRFLVQKNPQVSVVPIIGAKTLAQLEDNLGAATLVLTDDQMARLDKVSEPVRGYPWLTRTREGW